MAELHSQSVHRLFDKAKALVPYPSSAYIYIYIYIIIRDLGPDPEESQRSVLVGTVSQTTVSRPLLLETTGVN